MLLLLENVLLNRRTISTSLHHSHYSVAAKHLYSYGCVFDLLTFNMFAVIDNVVVRLRCLKFREFFFSKFLGIPLFNRPCNSIEAGNVLLVMEYETNAQCLKFAGICSLQFTVFRCM